jgi:signal transduction histidine kinase
MAMLVHELRTPLTTAWGHVQMATRTLERDGSMSVLAKSLEIAEAQLRRLRRLLGEVPTSSDPGGAPMFAVTTEPTDIVALVRGATSRHGQRHVLELHADTEVLMATIDADRIDEIVENLIANAELYTVAGGTILITLARAEPAGAIKLEVQDSGIGVPDADRPHLFEPYRRGSNVGERGGTGLGLYISRLIAQRHGGDLLLGPSSSTGTTFTLLLPAQVPK